MHQRPDSEVVAERLSAALAAPRDVLALRTATFDDVLVPRLVLEMTARVLATSHLQDARLVALEVTFTPVFELPGEAPISLGDPIVVGAPDQWDVILRDDGAHARSLDYAHATEHAAAVAATLLTDRLGID